MVKRVEMLQSDHSDESQQDSHVDMVVGSNRLETGKSVFLVFDLQGQHADLVQFIHLRSTMYGQALRSADLQEKSDNLLRASSRFVPTRLLNWLEQTDTLTFNQGTTAL